MEKNKPFPIPGLTEEENLKLTPSQRYYRRNPDKHKKWKEDNKEHLRLWQKEHYNKNKIRINANNRKNRLSHIELSRAKEKEKRNQIKFKVMSHYGHKCQCCKETRLDFLTIDHINNNGAEHRKTFGKAQKVYRFLISHNFPEGYQILCFNCNLSKHFNRGKCIHEIEREKTNYVSFDLGFRFGQYLSQ